MIKKMAKFDVVFLLTLAFPIPGVYSGLGRCGGYARITSTSAVLSGTLQSPNFPDYYGALSNCIWLLEVDSDKTIGLTVDSVLGEHNSNLECIDYLEVRSGSGESELLYKSCNDTTGTTITTPGPWLWIRFYSDSEQNYKGFSATWTQNDVMGNQTTSPINSCPSTQFGCGNKECVSWSWVCDGVNDCGCSPEGDEDNERCTKAEMGQNLKLAIGISIGSFIIAIIVIIVGAWEKWLQEQRRKRNEQFIKKPIDHEANFIQLQRQLRRASVMNQPNISKTRRNAFVLGIELMMPDSLEETSTGSAPQLFPLKNVKKPKITRKQTKQVLSKPKTHASSKEKQKVASKKVADQQKVESGQVS